MTFKKKVSLITLSTLMSTSMLVGCSQNNQTKNINSKEL